MRCYQQMGSRQDVVRVRVRLDSVDSQRLGPCAIHPYLPVRRFFR